MRPGPLDVTDVDPVVGRPGTLTVVVDGGAGSGPRPFRAACVAATAARTLPDGRLVAVLHGPYDTDLDALVRWLDAGAPDPAPVRQGFAVVLADPAGRTLRCAVGARTEAVLDYAVTPAGLVVSSHPRGVVDRLPRPPDLRADARAILADPAASAFVGVDRLPGGHLLDWAPGRELVVRRWFRPEDGERWSGRADAAGALRAVLLDAVAASLPRDAPAALTAATLSGGLDSAAVVGAAARLLGSAVPLPCAMHVPLPGTQDQRPGWEASDEPYGATMEQATGTVSVAFVRNDDRALGIDLVEGYAEGAYRPILNVDNLVWLRPIADWADGLGAAVVLTGSAGNLWFSRVGDAGTGPAALRRLRHRMRLRSRLTERADGERPSRLRRSPSRRHAHLALPVTPGAGSWFGRQSATAGYWHSDPLSDPEVVRLAYALPPQAWAPGGVPRGLARAALAGLVPDEIRLRRTRGGQAADAGLLIRAGVDRYVAALDRLAGSSSARRLVDVDELRAQVVAGLPADEEGMRRWRARDGRLIGLGLFAAWWDERRADWPQRPGQRVGGD